MIEEVNLRGIPCFEGGPEVMSPIKQITLVYGPNGSGKSSIAKQIRDQSAADMDVQFFNQEVINQLVVDDHALSGVVTFRDASPQDQARLEILEGSGKRSGSIAGVQNKIGSLQRERERKEAIRAKDEREYKDKIWNDKDLVAPELQIIFDGYRGSKGKLLGKVREVHKDKQVDQRCDIEELKMRAAVLANANGQIQSLLELPSLSLSLSEDELQLLGEELTIKADGAFGAFVEKLGNGDWVREGVTFLEVCESKCPFCQQSIGNGVRNSLHSLFSDSYVQSLARLSQMKDREGAVLAAYEAFLNDLQLRGFADRHEVYVAANYVCDKIRVRLTRIIAKLGQPALVVSHDECDIDVTALLEELGRENAKIVKMNAAVSNRESSLARLREEIWDYFVFEIAETSVRTYEHSLGQWDKAIGEIERLLEQNREVLSSLEAERDEIRKRLAGTAETVNKINKTLGKLGFSNFTLVECGDERYEIVRSDGQSANKTLSEGEKTLVSFLYFYNKVLAAARDRSSSKEMIIVIDDPVSSLDSEMLQYINLAIRGFFIDCAKGESRIAQVVLLTHNAYFYKEAAFVPRNQPAGTRVYYILGKAGSGGSTISSSERCKITSLYDELWDTVKNAKAQAGVVASPNLPNAMRRIVENYFKLGGSLPGVEIVENAEEWERPIISSLLAWYNDGSHSAPWDVDYSSISRNVEVYLQAFERLFELSGHKAHYDMMMTQ